MANCHSKMFSYKFEYTEKQTITKVIYQERFSEYMNDDDRDHVNHKAPFLDLQNQNSNLLILATEQIQIGSSVKIQQEIQTNKQTSPPISKARRG